MSATPKMLTKLRDGSTGDYEIVRSYYRILRKLQDTPVFNDICDYAFDESEDAQLSLAAQDFLFDIDVNFVEDLVPAVRLCVNKTQPQQLPEGQAARELFNKLIQTGDVKTVYEMVSPFYYPVAVNRPAEVASDHLVSAEPTDAVSENTHFMADGDLLWRGADISSAPLFARTPKNV